MILKIRKNYFIFGLVFLAAFFIFSSNKTSAQTGGRNINTFLKPSEGTLFAEEWNDLLGYNGIAVFASGLPLGSFVPTFLPAMMTGPLGIGMEPVVGGARLNVRADETNNILSLQNSAGTAVMTVLNNGNVGIGTNDPISKLHLQGQGSELLLRGNTVNTDNFASISFGEDGASPARHFSIVADGVSGTGSGRLKINSLSYGDIMIIERAGNVGIGTTAPGHRLSVAGSATSYSIDAGNQKIGNVADPTIAKDVVNLGFLNSSLSAFAPGGASSTWTISGNNIYNNNYLTGRVGIGTNNPQTMLTLGNNGWISSINYSGTGHINMFRVNTNNQIEVGASLLINQFQFAADSGYNTFVDMPVTAAAPLDSIQGYALRVDGENILTVYSESDGSGGIKNKRVGINVTNPAAADLDIDGYLRTQGINVKGFSNSAGIVMSDIDGNLYSNTSPEGTIALPSGIAGQTLRYVDGVTGWQANSVLYNNGTNVGVGTTVPSQKLHVTGNALIDAGNMLYFRDTTSYINESSGLNIVAGNTRSLNLAGGTGIDMTITSAGNVGIGTTNPGQKLEVTGEIGIFKGSSTWEEMIRLGRADFFRYNSIYSVSGSGTSSGMQFRIHDGVTATSQQTRMTIMGDGNVGIGTTGPVAKLDVVGEGKFSGMLTLTGQGNSGSNSYGMVSDTALNIQHPSGGSSSIYFRSGVNYPSDFGYIRFEDSYTGSGENARLSIGVENDQGANDYLLLKSRTVVDSDGFSSDHANIMEWLAAGVERARLTSAGNFGIGTTNPGTYRLYVNGGNAYFSGNMGIGIAPTERLSVNGSITTNDNTFVNKKFTMLDNINPQYILLCRNAGSNDVNGEIRVARTSSHHQAASLDIIVTSKTTGVIGGSLTTNQFTEADEKYSLVTVTYNAESYVAIKYDGWLYPSTVAHFSGRLVTTGTNSLITVNASQISDEALLSTANSKITMTGNVGIGTTAPGHKLSVAGSATSYSIDAGNQKIGNVADPTVAKDVVTLGYLNSIGGGSNWTLSGSNLYNNNLTGNVGVGTTGPIGKFHIRGADPVLYIHDTETSLASTKSFIKFTESDGVGDTERTWRIGNDSDTYRIAFSSDDNNGAGTYSDFFTVLNNGSVGIGTTAPLKNLEISSASPFMRFQTTGSSEYVVDIGAQFSTESFKLSVGKTTPYTVFSTEGYHTPEITHIWSNNAKTMTLNTGNVGIGSTTPAHRLVVSNSATSYSIDAGNQKIGNVADPTTTKDVVNLGYLNSSLSALGPGGASSTWTVSGNNIYNNNQTGNVGIGTTAPGDKLDIAGAISLSSNISWAAGNLPRMYKDSAHGLVLKGGTGSTGDFGIASNVGQWLFYNPTGTNNVALVKDVGNVGIGTTNPAYKLDVNGNIGINADAVGKGIFAYSGSNQMFSLTRQTIPNNATLAITSYSDMGFAANKTGGASTAYDMIIRSGNVGIGTTVPGAKLDVYGNIYAGLSDQVQITATNNGSLYYHAANGTSFTIGTKTYANPLIFAINSIERMRVSNTGNVGIGSTTPAHRLVVSNSATSYSIDAGNQKIGNVADPTVTKDAVNLGYLNSSLSAFAPGGASSTWTFSGNNIFNTNQAGNVGIGTNNPPTMLTLGNNGWISSINNAGTGHINMFRVNTDNQIEVGGPLLINQFQFAADSGYNTFVGMPVTAAAPLDSIQGYALRVDGENILTVYSESDGSGGIKNKRVGINVTNPATADLDINGYMRTQGINVKGFVSSPGLVIADDLGNLSSSPGLTLKTTYVDNVNYTVNADDSIIAYRSISANRTVSLPDSLCVPGRFFVIMDQSGSAGSAAQIIIDPAGTTPIVGNLTFSLASPYNAVYVFCGTPSGSPAWFLL